ncbi:uncharacterized protein LOC131944796 [Physella acuta]|uniref:uncharacterized protein LOC131944796 n=1 Tax=Physella acuta TaxID=109671 RepID=UPI0027DD92E1|nr:uncharacterized protein LOC131944796 [Physella acuta]
MCLPYSPDVLKDGRPCYLGYCQGGECKLHLITTFDRLHSFLQALSGLNLREFLKSNTVLLVIIAVSVLWIPVACCFYQADKKQGKKLIKESCEKTSVITFKDSSDAASPHSWLSRCCNVLRQRGKVHPTTETHLPKIRGPFRRNASQNSSRTTSSIVTAPNVNTSQNQQNNCVDVTRLD